MRRGIGSTHIDVTNYVLEMGSVRSLTVGIFNSTLHKFIASNRTIIWPGNTSAVPKDYFVAGTQVDSGSGDFCGGCL